MKRGRPGAPLAMETGFWRPLPDRQLEVLIVHPTGISEMYLGEVTGTKIELATDAVLRTATAKEVTAGHRLYGLVEGDLAYAYDMAAMGQPLQAHASARLKQVAGWPRRVRRVTREEPVPRRTVTPKKKIRAPGRLPLRGPAGQGRSARGSGVCRVLADRRHWRRPEAGSYTGRRLADSHLASPTSMHTVGPPPFPR